MEILRKAWVGLGDGRQIEAIWDASPGVSTNRVFRILLNDGRSVFAKIVSYGSFIHFRQDHHRIAQWSQLLAGTRFRNFLAPIVQKDDEPYIYRSNHDWVVFFEEVPAGEHLSRQLSETQIHALAREMAEFHCASRKASGQLDPTWKTMGSDIAALFDRVSDPRWGNQRHFSRNAIALVERHCESFFRNAERLGYHELPKIPLLVDWNITNFSIESAEDGAFSLFRRWDYDWFRIEPRVLDFYFLSRVVRAEGDTSRFSYTPDMFLEPRFLRFLSAYHEVSPLDETEILFLRESYRFFVLCYVLNLGEHFFQWSLRMRLQREAVDFYLPAADDLNLDPLLRIVR